MWVKKNEKETHFLHLSIHQPHSPLSIVLYITPMDFFFLTFPTTAMNSLSKQQQQ
jgi:hypothetical protein